MMLNSHGMMLGAVPDPGWNEYENCLALFRPAYVSGAWGIKDASPFARAVVNSGMIIGDEGTGPWGGTSRALIDGAATYRCFIVGGTGFGAVKSGACWFYPTHVGHSEGKFFFKIGRNTAARPFVGMGYVPAPAPNATTHIRLFAYCAEASTLNPYVIATSTAIFPLNSWIFCGIKLPSTTPGAITLWADGSLVATTSNTTPAVGQSDAAFGVGYYGTDGMDGTYDARGRYAEAGIWSVTRDFSVIPTGPYTT